MNYILGISAYYHDSAAALLADGEVIAAAQEERFTRIKQDKSFPINAVKYCLSEAAISLDCLDMIVYYENPPLKLGRIFSTYFNFGYKSHRSFISELPEWLTKKLRIRKTLEKELELSFGKMKTPRIHCLDHHESHAASAFYPSPFQEAAVLCIDGVGEWATTSAWLGQGKNLSLLWEIKFPHSLGLLYSAFTYFCGFKVDSGEYKLMGLAPYGEPVYYQQIVDNLIDIKPDGSFRLNMDYFDYATGYQMTSDRFEELFGGPRREPESLITNREFNLAASIQAVLDDVVLSLAKTVRRESGSNHLCMAGGVALNCMTNGKLLKTKTFDSIWVQPAAGDSGGAIGAAFTGWHKMLGKERLTTKKDKMKGSLLGTFYSSNQISSQLDKFNAKSKLIADKELIGLTADLLAQGHVIGWFQGRMEFGPRALGARSILGDPRNPKMQTTMNLKIKNRESFRPFAPAVLEEHVAEWFDLDHASPYMLFVVPVNNKKHLKVTENDNLLTGIEKLNVVRSTIPAVTHVNYSARVQTVNRLDNPLFYDLIDAFYKQTDCPVLVNTSFNVRGEPIVESPSDAYTCFMRTKMDYLIIGNYILDKNDQPSWNENNDWQKIFALD